LGFVAPLSIGLPRPPDLYRSFPFGRVLLTVQFTRICQNMGQAVDGKGSAS
jgi:hypothetical protein